MDVTTDLAALPPHLADAVVDFLVGDDFYHGNGRRYWSRQLHPLRRVAAVSRDWHAAADDAASARLLHTLSFRYKQRNEDEPVTRSEVLATRRALTLRRAHLQRLVVEDVPDIQGDIGEGVWRAALAHAPRLRSLDMDTGDLVGPRSSQVLAITRAAASQCPGLQRLMLPSRMSRPATATGNHIHELIRGVYECLRTWSKHGGGLRLLRMTMRERVVGRVATREYVDMLARYCPKIEIIDGFAPAVDSVQLVGCEERWRVDVETWTRFCESCTQLTMFDWVTVPFATRFFQVFGATVKPQLVNLTLSATYNWRWRKYWKTVQDTSTRAVLEATGYGGLATDIHTVLPACPNLKELRVEWFEQRWRRHPRASIQSCINPEIFGDEFCETLARSCKLLTSLHHAPTATSSRRWSPASIVTLTDRSLNALTILPDLEQIQIVGANITGGGLYRLIAHHAASTRRTRQYFFTLGDTVPHGATAMVFYDVLAELLDKILENDPVSSPVALRLVNNNKTYVEDAWSAAYSGQVLETLEKVQEKHPALQLQILLRDYDPDYGVFQRVSEFVLATGGATLPDWHEEDANVMNQETVDGVVVNRSYADEEDSGDERAHRGLDVGEDPEDDDDDLESDEDGLLDDGYGDEEEDDDEFGSIGDDFDVFDFGDDDVEPDDVSDEDE